MKIENRKEKIIFTEEEARAMVLVYKLMQDIQDDIEDNDVWNLADDTADFLGTFIENELEGVDCVVCQPVADSVREISISIAIK